MEPLLHRRVPGIPMVLALALAGCAGSEDLPFPVGAHLVEDEALSEMSGLVASHRQPGVLWSINDSGSFARLYRVGPQGQALGRVQVRGAWLHDTEALARWRADGRDWLLLGDVGDNHARRDDVVVHAVAEPDDADEHAEIAWSLRIRYPDGPLDVEGVAVDQRRGELLLMTKRDPARMYRVPLSTRNAGTPVVAEFVGAPRDGAMRGAVTGLDLSEDGAQLAVLTYHGLYVWRRGDGEAWSDVLARDPESVARPAMHKAEAMALAPDGERLLVGSERRPTPLWVGRRAPDDDDAGVVSGTSP